ncbi:hypothetical protein FGB62_665g00 [Gracilaria domingensis]|nr:hypothetical protein FGB62_665g00 [Gracilaria domingensis]
MNHPRFHRIAGPVPNLTLKVITSLDYVQRCHRTATGSVRLFYRAVPFIQTVAQRQGLAGSKVYRAWQWWSSNGTESPPQGTEDIHLFQSLFGRPTNFNEDEEVTIARAVIEYAYNHTPLTRHGVCMLAEHLFNAAVF